MRGGHHLIGLRSGALLPHTAGPLHSPCSYSFSLSFHSYYQLLPVFLFAFHLLPRQLPPPPSLRHDSKGQLHSLFALLPSRRSKCLWWLQVILFLPPRSFTFSYSLIYSHSYFIPFPFYSISFQSQICFLVFTIPNLVLPLYASPCSPLVISISLPFLYQISFPSLSLTQPNQPPFFILTVPYALLSLVLPSPKRAFPHPFSPLPRSVTFLMVAKKKILTTKR